MIAIFAGTFDPIHNGHLDIIERAARLFDEVRVAIARNPSKTPRFELERRLDLIRDSVSATNVSTDSFDGLIVDYASQFDRAILLRGIRNATDLEYENQMAELNRAMRPAIDSVYLPTSAAVSAISSTYIRQISSMGGDVSAFVPFPVLRALQGD